MQWVPGDSTPENGVLVQWDSQTGATFREQPDLAGLVPCSNVVADGSLNLATPILEPLTSGSYAYGLDCFVAAP